MSHRNGVPEETGRDIAGVRVGIVRDNQDPENLGRVKLEFPWRDADDESYWARIATNMTGSGYGTYFLPEVEDEVLVGFENGDIHSPIVIGSLWSGNRAPPETNADGNNDVRKIETRNGHSVEFDDNDTQGHVTIETSAGHLIDLDDTAGSESITITDKSGNAIDMNSTAGTVSIDANTSISLTAPTIKLSADKEVTIDGKKKVDVSSNAETNVSGTTLTVEGVSVEFNADGTMQLKGAIIQLN